MRIVAVNVAADLHTGEPWTGSHPETGIDKRPVDHRVRVYDDHVEGDRVIDRKHHGGTYKAVYAYAREDAQWWESEIGRPLSAGSFGENLTTEGIDLTNAVIGEQWRVGSTLLQVSQPRIACRVFAGFWDRPQLVKEFSDARRPGVYLQIIQEGDIGAGDTIEIVRHPTHAVTVGIANAAKLGDVAALQQLRGNADLPPAWLEWVEQRLS